MWLRRARGDGSSAPHPAKRACAPPPRGSPAKRCLASVHKAAISFHGTLRWHRDTHAHHPINTISQSVRESSVEGLGGTPARGRTSVVPVSSSRRSTCPLPGITRKSHPCSAHSSWARSTARKPVESINVSRLRSSSTALTPPTHRSRIVVSSPAATARSSSPLRRSV
jgi:hypothetical protein